MLPSILDEASLTTTLARIASLLETAKSGPTRKSGGTPVTLDILAKQMSAKYGALADQFDACAARLSPDDRSGWAHAKVQASIARLSIANVVLSAHHSADAAVVLHLIANDLGAVLTLSKGVAESRDSAVARSVLQTVNDELQGIADKGDAYSLRRDGGSATPQPSPS